MTIPSTRQPSVLITLYNFTLWVARYDAENGKEGHYLGKIGRWKREWRTHTSDLSRSFTWGHLRSIQRRNPMHWNCLQLHRKWRKGEEIAKDGGASFQFARDVGRDLSCVVQWHQVKGSHNCKSMNFNFLKHFVSSVSVDPFFSFTFMMLKYEERWDERGVKGKLTPVRCSLRQGSPVSICNWGQCCAAVLCEDRALLHSFLLLCGDRANHKSLPAWLAQPGTGANTREG